MENKVFLRMLLVASLIFQLQAGRFVDEDKEATKKALNMIKEQEDALNDLVDYADDEELGEVAYAFKRRADSLEEKRKKLIHSMAKQRDVKNLEILHEFCEKLRKFANSLYKYAETLENEFGLKYEGIEGIVKQSRVIASAIREQADFLYASGVVVDMREHKIEEQHGRLMRQERQKDLHEKERERLRREELRRQEEERREQQVRQEEMIDFGAEFEGDEPLRGWYYDR